MLKQFIRVDTFCGYLLSESFVTVSTDMTYPVVCEKKLLPISKVAQEPGYRIF
jgi:hypothetical protein